MRWARRRWTREDDLALARLVSEGVSQTQIGRRLRRSTSSVRSRITLLRRTGVMDGDCSSAPVPQVQLPIEARVSQLCHRYGWRGSEVLP